MSDRTSPGCPGTVSFFLLAGYPLKIFESWNQPLQFQTRNSPFKIFIFQNSHIWSQIFLGGFNMIQPYSTHFLDILWAFHVGDTLGWPPGPPCPGHRAAHASHRAGADGTCRTLAGGVAAGCFSREGLLGGLKYGYGSIP